MTTFLASVLVPIALALLSNPTINLFSDWLKRRRVKKLLNIIESKEILEKFDESFKSSFVQPDLKENYFLLQTGILTNHNCIEAYIELKNKLGEDYGWKPIRLARKFLKPSEDGLVVVISKQDRIINNIVLIFGFLSIVAGSLISTYFQDLGVKTFNEFLILIFITLIPFGIGYALINSITAFLNASNIERRLKTEKNKLNNPTIKIDISQDINVFGCRKTRLPIF